jgi:hypothetical protein
MSDATRGLRGFWAIVTVCFTGLASETVTGEPRDFEVPFQFTSAPTGFHAVVADFDRDGRPDFATSGGFTVAVLRGLGGGRFERWPDARNVYGVAVGAIESGDFDGDGLADLLVHTDSLRVLRGRGDGSFAPAGATSGGFNVNAIAAIDLDRDGRDEALLTVAGSVRVVSLESGVPTMTTLASTIGDPWQVEALDVDADGAPEVLCWRPGQMNVYRPPGDGTLGPPIGFPVGEVEDVDVADLDGDAVPEIVAATNWGVDVLVADGVGGFVVEDTMAYSPSSYWRRSVACADFDGDGRADFVTGVHAGEGASINRFHRGRGDRTFDPPRPIGPIHGMYPLFAVGLEPDGPVDLLGVVYPGIVVVRGPLDPERFVLDPFTSSAPTSLVHGDLDNDGFDDLAWYQNTGTGSIQVALAGSGGMRAGVTIPVPGYSLPVAIADMDRDGAADLVLRHDVSRILRGDGFGGFPDTLATPGDSARGVIAVVDATGDGWLDLIATWSPPGLIQFPADTLLLFEQNPAGGFRPARVLPVTGKIRTVVCGDWNEDGLPDLVVARNGDPVHLRQQPGGVFVSAGTIATGSEKPANVDVGDFDGDGHADLVYPDRGEVCVRLGTGLGSWGPARRRLVWSNPVRTYAADLDGDGRDEVLVGYGPAGVTVLDFESGALSEPAFFGSRGWGTPAVLDFDQDGALDIAVLGFGLALHRRITTPSTGVSPTATAPELRLHPSPARTSITVRFAAPPAGVAELRIHDVAGRLVARVPRATDGSETIEASWDLVGDDGRRVEPGVYFATLAIAGRRTSRRFVVLR